VRSQILFVLFVDIDNGNLNFVGFLLLRVNY